MERIGQVARYGHHELQHGNLKKSARKNLESWIGRSGEGELEIGHKFLARFRKLPSEPLSRVRIKTTKGA
jgi:hypothetical protein